MITVATAICPEQLINVRQDAPPNPPLVRMVRNPDLGIITDSDVVAIGLSALSKTHSVQVSFATHAAAQQFTERFRTEPA